MNFFDTYREELRRAVQEHPDDYHYSVEDVDAVADRMIAAMQRGSYNKDGRAFKATCNRLRIPHTYKAINAYLKAEMTVAKLEAKS